MPFYAAPATCASPSCSRWGAVTRVIVGTLSTLATGSFDNAFNVCKLVKLRGKQIASRHARRLASDIRAHLDSP